MVAYGIDIVLLFVILAPVGFLAQWILGLPLPQTGPMIWRTLLWNFSLPAWLYFIGSDASATGATLGKRLLHLHVQTVTQHRLAVGQALLRTAIKLLPWELVHLSAFALATDLSQFSLWQTLGLGTANVLVLLYVVVAGFYGGRCSVHDWVAKTEVRRESAHEAL